MPGVQRKKISEFIIICVYVKQYPGYKPIILLAIKFENIGKDRLLLVK